MTSSTPGAVGSSAKFATSSWTRATRNRGRAAWCVTLPCCRQLGSGQMAAAGFSAALSEAEVHWRAFLEDLVSRGMRGVRFITSDDHAGLEAARKAVLGGAIWQRCQFHLAQNAIHHAPNVQIRKRIGSQLREVWNAKNLATAEAELKCLVEAHRKNAPELAAWLEVAIPEGLAVFTLPEHHRKRMRTANPIERAVQQELKRRTVKVRVL